MSDDPVNPYAPPESSEAATEEGAGWSIEGETLILREGIRLPAVDLDGRGAGGPLTPVLLKMPVPVGTNGWAGVIPSLMLFCFIAFQRWLPFRVGWPGVIGVVALYFLLVRGWKARRAPTRGMEDALVWGKVSVNALRKRARRAKWRSGLVVVGLLLMLLFSFGVAGVVGGTVSRGEDMPDWLLSAAVGVFSTGSIAVAGAAFWSALDNGWRCVKAHDGWLWIRGIGHQGLIELSREDRKPLPVVKRKTCMLYLSRMPLDFWAASNGWKPGAWVRTLGMKLKGPAAMDRWVFHWSERQWLTPDQGDVALLEEWRRATDGTPLAGWPMIHAERLDDPGGATRVEELVFLSPDGRHAAIPAVTRVAVGKSFQELRETNFRSWARDGRTLATGTVRTAGPEPDDFDYCHAAGSPWEVAQRHLQRVAAEELVVVDAAGLRLREERELESRRVVMEAAGFYGQVESLDLPGM